MLSASSNDCHKMKEQTANSGKVMHPKVSVEGPTSSSHGGSEIHKCQTMKMWAKMHLYLYLDLNKGLTCPFLIQMIQI